MSGASGTGKILGKSRPGQAGPRRADRVGITAKRHTSRTPHRGGGRDRGVDNMDEQDSGGLPRARSRTIKHLQDSDIIEVRYAGEVSYRYRIETIDALQRMTPEGGFRRLLINYTSAWPIPEPEPEAVAEFGARMGQLTFAKGARVALVNAPADVESQTQEVLTQGGFLYRQFDDRALAMAWLQVVEPGGAQE